MATQVNNPYLLQSSYFEAEKLSEIEDVLQNLSEAELEKVNNIKFRDSFNILFISVCFGTLGIDRFLIGDNKIGLLKFILFEVVASSILFYSLEFPMIPYSNILRGVGVLLLLLALVDWFLIQKATHKSNYKKLMEALESK